MPLIWAAWMAGGRDRRCPSGKREKADDGAAGIAAGWGRGDGGQCRWREDSGRCGHSQGARADWPFPAYAAWSQGRGGYRERKVSKWLRIAPSPRSKMNPTRSRFAIWSAPRDHFAGRQIALLEGSRDHRQALFDVLGHQSFVAHFDLLTSLVHQLQREFQRPPKLPLRSPGSVAVEPSRKETANTRRGRRKPVADLFNFRYRVHANALSQSSGRHLSEISVSSGADGLRSGWIEGVGAAFGASR